MKINVHDIIDAGQLKGVLLKVFLACFLIGVCEGYCMYIFAVTGTNIRESLGFTAVQQGVISSYTTWGMTAASIVIGPIADKIGRKRVLIFSVICYSLCTGSTGFATEMWQFAIVRFLAGCGMAGIVPVCVATTSEYSPYKNRPMLCTLVAMGTSLGMLFAGLFAMWMLPVVRSWRVLYYIAFFPLLVAVAALTLPESMHILIKNGKRSEIEKVLSSCNNDFKTDPRNEYVTTFTPATKVRWIEVFAKETRRNTIAVWIMYFCNMAIIYGAGTWLPGIMDNAGYSVATGILLFVVFSTGSMIFSPIGGKLIGKFGYKKIMIIDYVITVISLCLFGLSANNMTLSIILIFFAGAASNSCQTIIQPFAGHFYDLSTRTTGIGWGIAMGRLGSAVAPIVLGLLIAANVPLQVNFFGVAAMAAIAGLACLSTKEPTTKKM